MNRVDTLLRRLGLREALEQAQVQIEIVPTPRAPRISMPRRFDFLTGGFPPPPGEEADYMLNNNGYFPTNYFMLNYFPEYGAETPAATRRRGAYLGVTRRKLM